MTINEYMDQLIDSNFNFEDGPIPWYVLAGTYVAMQMENFILERTSKLISVIGHKDFDRDTLIEILDHEIDEIEPSLIEKF